MQFKNIDNWNNTLDSITLIGGSARSGTTIMGKLMHSMKGVEYFFEPPMILPLMINEKNIDITVLKELLGFYLYDQLFLDALGGRNINTNIHDDSSIYNVKSKEEIDFRLSKSFRRVELEKISIDHKIAFKLPANVFFDKSWDILFPKNTKIYMHRDLNDTLNSLIGKGWFSDEALHKNSKSQVYATRIENNIKIPFWVKEDDISFWITSNELDRTAYYYLLISEQIANATNNVIIVHYDKFLNKPLEVIESIAANIGTTITDMTMKLISEIKKTEKERENLIQNINPNLLEQIDLVSKNIKITLPK